MVKAAAATVGGDTVSAYVEAGVQGLGKTDASIALAHTPAHGCHWSCAEAEAVATVGAQQGRACTKDRCCSPSLECSPWLLLKLHGSQGSNIPEYTQAQVSAASSFSMVALASQRLPDSQPAPSRFTTVFCP